MSDVYSIVREAIIHKQQIIATYRGLDRELCPHVIGMKRGKPQALFYQFGGDSRTGLEPYGSMLNWRCMLIYELRDVIAREGEWHTAPRHSRPRECVDDIDVEVAFSK